MLEDKKLVDDFIGQMTEKITKAILTNTSKKRYCRVYKHKQ